MSCIMFARWFGVVSVLLSLGILFNLEDAQEMAKGMVKTETGYIMGGVLPIIFGTLSLLFVDCFDACWHLVVTFVGASMVLAGIPFLFSLFGLMLGVILLYVGFLSTAFQFTAH